MNNNINILIGDTMSFSEDLTNFIEELKKLKDTYPNDQEFGKLLRKILNDIN
jgi:hypothetical protein